MFATQQQQQQHDHQYPWPTATQATQRRVTAPQKKEDKVDVRPKPDVLARLGYTVSKRPSMPRGVPGMVYTHVLVSHDIDGKKSIPTVDVYPSLQALEARVFELCGYRPNGAASSERMLPDAYAQDTDASCKWRWHAFPLQRPVVAQADGTLVASTAAPTAAAPPTAAPPTAAPPTAAAPTAAAPTAAPPFAKLPPTRADVFDIPRPSHQASFPTVEQPPYPNTPFAFGNAPSHPPASFPHGAAPVRTPRPPPPLPRPKPPTVPVLPPPGILQSMGYPGDATIRPAQSGIALTHTLVHWDRDRDAAATFEVLPSRSAVDKRIKALCGYDAAGAISSDRVVDTRWFGKCSVRWHVHVLPKPVYALEDDGTLFSEQPPPPPEPPPPPSAPPYAIQSARDVIMRGKQGAAYANFGNGCQEADNLIRDIEDLRVHQEKVTDVLTTRDAVLWMQSRGVEGSLQGVVQVYAQTVAALYTVHASMGAMCKSASPHLANAEGIRYEVLQCIQASKKMMAVVGEASRDFEANESRWSKLKRYSGALGARIAAATSALVHFAWRNKLRIATGAIAVYFMYGCQTPILKTLGQPSMTSINKFFTTLWPEILKPLCNVLRIEVVLPLSILLGIYAYFGRVEGIDERLEQGARKIGRKVTKETVKKVKSMREKGVLAAAMAALQSSDALSYLLLFMSVGCGGANVALICTRYLCEGIIVAHGTWSQADANLRDTPITTISSALTGGALTKAALLGISSFVGIPVYASIGLLAGGAGAAFGGTYVRDKVVNHFGDKSWKSQEIQGFQDLLEYLIGTMNSVKGGMDNIGATLSNPAIFTLLLSVSGVALAWDGGASAEDNVKASIKGILESAQDSGFEDKDVLQLLRELSKTQQDVARIVQSS